MSEHVPFGDCTFCKEGNFVLCQAALALQDIYDYVEAHPHGDLNTSLDSGIQVKQWAEARKCPYVCMPGDISKTG